MKTSHKKLLSKTEEPIQRCIGDKCLSPVKPDCKYCSDCFKHYILKYTRCTYCQKYEIKPNSSFKYCYGCNTIKSSLMPDKYHDCNRCGKSCDKKYPLCYNCNQSKKNEIEDYPIFN